MINAIAALLSLLAMTLLGIEGANWLTLGYGINPWIAFPAACVFAFLGYVMAYRWVRDVEHASLMRRHNALLENAKKMDEALHQLRCLIK